mgnify:CR=1 FL=1
MRSDPTKIPDNTAANPDAAEATRKPVTIPPELDKAEDGGDRSTKNDRELDVETAASEDEPTVMRKPIEIESEPNQ